MFIYAECHGLFNFSLLLVSFISMPICLTKNRRTQNFWNAVKYATAFPLVYAGYLDRLAPTDQTRRLVVLTACVQSSATFAWDLCMDWGLFKKREGFTVWHLRGRPDAGTKITSVFET